ncbi:adhesion G-protein coupled receptor D1-like [Ptychodera flava]|uniref:adhesion G-protein coupled receptor D1-like n=1 Tax=Ptychodera flava TaxID=63121 RepID=UPI003969DE81
MYQYETDLKTISPCLSRQIACTAVAALLHYFFTSVFCWMLVEGIHLYFQLVVVLKKALRRRFMAYYLIGWGVPLVLVAISVGFGHAYYGTDDNCWLSVESDMIFAFIGPMLAVILFNLVILGIALRVICRRITNKTEDKYKNIRSSLKAAILLLPLLGMTWLFGLLSVDRHTIFFEYVFAVLNSLQGFFIFIFYCWTSKEVRSQLARRKIAFLTARGQSGSVTVWSSFGMTTNRVMPSRRTATVSVNHC